MQIVSLASEVKNVVATCIGSDLLKSLLPHLMEQLEFCQKSLSAYLEAKRAEFPRFYFVSDPTLLEILSLGSDPPSVVPHFQSGLFDSLSNVSFDKVLSLLCSHLPLYLLATSSYEQGRELSLQDFLAFSSGYAARFLRDMQSETAPRSSL